jgi:hypothetical protein
MSGLTRHFSKTLVILLSSFLILYFFSSSSSRDIFSYTRDIVLVEWSGGTSFPTLFFSFIYSHVDYKQGWSSLSSFLALLFSLSPPFGTFFFSFVSSWLTRHTFFNISEWIDKEALVYRDLIVITSSCFACFNRLESLALPTSFPLENIVLLLSSKILVCERRSNRSLYGRRNKLKGREASR